MYRDRDPPHPWADKGTGAFQYFIKLVPTMRKLDPEGGLLAQDGGKGAEQLASLTSQFAYTYKFRSLKGATEYHTEHQDGEEEEDKGNGAKKAAAINSMLLPGLCRWVCALVRTSANASSACRPGAHGGF